ncbi:methionine adenosyltransferase [soil metagenome]
MKTTNRFQAGGTATIDEEPMKNTSYLWTSESVSPGHPDKVADQISDAVLDAFLAADPHAKVACEVMVKGRTVYIAGEITATTDIDDAHLETVVRRTICDIGYNADDVGFNGNTCVIVFDISHQSTEINAAVAKDGIVTAGDQGIMFGYASRETPTRMPLALYLSKEFITEGYGGRERGYPFRPDMKSQVSLLYEGGRAVHVDSVVFSTCHTESLTLSMLRELFHDEVLQRVVGKQSEEIQRLFTDKTRYFINPAGTWNIGGPVSDCGLTGRKIVVDQYGADCEIGGGAFSGKDPSKVDRSAAYMARHIALRTLAANEEAMSIKVQLAYAIGEEYPVSHRIYDPSSGREYGLASVTPHDLTPSAIIHHLGLQAPIYLATAHKGHFGIAPYEVNGVRHFAWEQY